MCLAIPGKILKIKGQIAEIDFSGIHKDVNIAMVNVKIGDFVMVHAGFAIEKMDMDLVSEIQGYLDRK
jgi:hydrogenase expression/formation protein HypC